MNKYVIYTVMTGGYESIMQPEIIDPRFDYVLFSNDFEEKRIGIWQVKKIECELKIDNKKLSRYPKLHPETLLSDYDASLYIDANLSIFNKWVYERFVELYNEGVVYSGIRLIESGRDCIYDHAFDMSIVGVVHDYDAIKQCHELYRRGFPRHYGLNENNVIYRRHTSEMKETDEEWWWWVTNYTPRDQFSYMYCLWHHKIPANNYFLPEGEDTHKGNYFRFISHNRSNVVKNSKWVKKSLIEKLRDQSWNYNRQKYVEQWYKVCQSSRPVLTMYLWGISTIILNIHNFINNLFTRPTTVFERLKH